MFSGVLCLVACGSVSDNPDAANGTADARVDASPADATPAPDAAPQLLSIAVMPGTHTLLLNTSQQYMAYGTYTDGTRDITASVTWSTMDGVVATVTAAGVVTGHSISTTTVSATLDGVTGSGDLNVVGLGSPEFPGLSCNDIVTSGSSVGDGRYWIDPTGSDAFEAWCEMTTDGGGWTLIAWHGESQTGTVGVPYPGLDPCPDFTCQRGSATTMTRMESLIRTGTELAKAQSAMSMATFGAMTDYTYAGKYVYGSLAGLTLVYGPNTCDGVNPLATGTYTSLVGAHNLRWPDCVRSGGARSQSGAKLRLLVGCQLLLLVDRHGGKRVSRLCRWL